MARPPFSDEVRDALREALLTWYRSRRRDLPWRRTRDPYAVWVSEIMLQQTRVDTVLPYYDRFLERWPTVQALAAADPDEVRAQWSGLGYYRRARLMLDCAQHVAETRDGVFPDTETELHALPGFGRYTAGAVASIAFDRATPAVDGNVIRAMARLRGLSGDPTKGAPNREVWAAAGQLVPEDAPGDFNQSLIELGALVCTARRPACDKCPVERWCVARAEGRVDEIPPPRKRAEKVAVSLTALVAIGPDGVLLERQPERGLFASLWCPPLLEGGLDPDLAADEAARRYGLQWRAATACGVVKHVLTHREMSLSVLRIEVDETPDGLARAPLHELEAWAVPSVTAKCLRAAFTPKERARARLPGRRTAAHRAERAGQASLDLDGAPGSVID